MDKSHYLKVRNILLGVLILNFTLAFTKIVYGMTTNTSSMTADGYNSLSDGTSNIVGIIGAWIASKPADEKHPYGHHKFETLATVVIGLLLFVVSYQILVEAYQRFKSPVKPEINVISFIIMIIILAINIFVANYESKKGRAYKSAILISDSKDKKSDIYVTLSVIVSLVASKYNLIIVDTIVAGIIAVLIIKSGLEILIPGLNILTDISMVDPEKISDLVTSYPSVVYCHKIRTRGKENHIMLELHVGIDRLVSIEKAHIISHEIKDLIIREFQDIREVIIHMEPA